MTAIIVQNDGGGPVAGSIDNGTTATPVALSNQDNTGVLGWFWELVYRPQGSSAAISSPYASATSFTTDVDGTYLVRLTTYTDAARTDPDDVDEQCYAIRLGAPYTWRIPAAGETVQYHPVAGWAPAVEASFRDMHAYLLSVPAAGGSPLPWVGAELFAWNRTDLTQFGTGSTLVCRTDIGGAPAGAITPTVDAGGRLGQARIVLTSSGGFTGGWAMPVTHGLSPLPNRFWIYTRFDAGASGGVGGFVTPFGIESPLAAGYFEGPMCIDSHAGATNSSPSYVSVYWPAYTSSLLTSSGMSPDSNWITVPKPYANASYYSGGVENLILVERQVDQDPTAGWWFRRYFRYSDGSTSGAWFRLGQQVVRANLTGSSDPAPEWNGLDMNQIYLGAYAASAQTGPFVAYSDFRIFEWDSAAVGQP